MPETTSPSRSLAFRWFQKGDNDLLNVENNLKAERYPADTVCFHCQQVAEKYLKGLLAWHSVPFARTHDLLALLQQVASLYDVSSGAQDLTPAISLLDQYSVIVRYPEESEEAISEQEASQARVAAYLGRAWVREQLGLLDGSGCATFPGAPHSPPPMLG